jgi:RNase P subunit RPR2
MFAYQFKKKIYCVDCYMKVVPEAERKPGHRLDGNGFYHKFQDHTIQCAECGVSMEYRNLFTTTNHSLREYDEEED